MKVEHRRCTNNPFLESRESKIPREKVADGVEGVRGRGGETATDKKSGPVPRRYSSLAKW